MRGVNPRLAESKEHLKTLELTLSIKYGSHRFLTLLNALQQRIPINRSWLV